MQSNAAQSLALVKARLRWAIWRIGEFEFSVDEFLRSKPFRIRRNLESAGHDPHSTVELTRISYRFEVRCDVPIELRFMAADAIHNLRAAMDNLVWACGQVHGASKSLGLPFAEDPVSFQKKCVPRIERLPLEVRQWIERQQEFRCPAGDPALLCRLNRLWNHDKHRLPTLLGSAVANLSIGITGSMSIHQLEVRQMTGLRDDDEIAYVVTGPQGVAHFSPRFSVDVSFDAP